MGPGWSVDLLADIMQPVPSSEWDPHNRRPPASLTQASPRPRMGSLVCPVRRGSDQVQGCTCAPRLGLRLAQRQEVLPGAGAPCGSGAQVPPGNLGAWERVLIQHPGLAPGHSPVSAPQAAGQFCVEEAPAAQPRLRPPP